MKRFIKDALLNILSAALPLMTLQLIAFPIIAKESGSQNFGVIVTLISILTVVSFPAGNVLNNIRLLRNEEYKKNKEFGDFNLLLLGNSMLSSLIMILLTIFFFKETNIFNIVVLALIVFSSVLKDYLVVSYRLTLNFRGILLNNVFLSFGYLMGTGIFYLTGIWEFIYLTGLVFSLIYIFKTTFLMMEPLKKTQLFDQTFKNYCTLYGAGLLKSMSNYADKIVLLPLLGPTNVSIYYAASILGKITLMFFNPVNTVILSYLVKKNKVDRKLFLKAFFLLGIVSIAGYFFTVIISPYFFKSFYPEWADESLKYIYITSAAATITVLATIFHPFNLRFNKLKWQVYMSGSNLLFFLLIAYILTTNYELLGFTIAVLLSSTFRFTFQLLVYFFSSHRNN